MFPLERYLLLQKKRWLAYLAVEGCISAVALAFSFWTLWQWLHIANQLWTYNFLPWVTIAFVVSYAVAAGMLVELFRRRARRVRLWQIADQVERESNVSHVVRGELRSAAYFQDENSTVDQADWLRAHHQRLASSTWVAALKPTGSFYLQYLLFLCAAISTFAARSYQWSIPNASLIIPTESWEVLRPLKESEWQAMGGSWTVVEGARVRIAAPDLGRERALLFLRSPSEIVASVCDAFCEWEPQKQQEAAVGSWLRRSEFLPMRVLNDERPRSVLLANAKGEFLPDLKLKVRSLKNLRFKATGSDDLEILKVEFIERNSDQAENILKTWNHASADFKAEWQMEWQDAKAGLYHYVVRLFDRQGSSESSSIEIHFVDDDELKKERAIVLRSVVDSWVHILGDLIEVHMGVSDESRLLRNLKAIEYGLPAESEENAALIVAYFNELQKLAKRIEKEISNSTRTPALIRRTERQILYGLSLLFQESVGDLESAQEDLVSSQAGLQLLLDRLKNGELPADSNQLKQAFKSIAEKIEELQKKIQSLPAGPTDDMINQEALQNQLEESESLQSRIEEIQKQIESGDSASALKELESLLNQMTLLTKEMDRSLSQWKDNFDRSSQASAQKYQKDLEALRKKQEALKEKSEQLKDSMEADRAERQITWKPTDPKKEEIWAEESRKLAQEQEGLQKEFQNAQQAFEKQLGESEWRDFFRSEEIQSLEEKAQASMQSSKESLQKRAARDSIAEQHIVVDALTKIQEKTLEKQRSLQAQAQRQQSQERKTQRIEVLPNEGQGELERRRKILDSLQQKVEPQYQKSHERYFEDLLQR